MFNWIRTSVKNAVLAGVGDAIETLRGDQDSAVGDQTERLTMATKLLPGPKLIEAEVTDGRRNRRS